MQNITNRRVTNRVIATLAVLCCSLLLARSAQAQVVVICSPARAPTDAVKIRFNFCVARNFGNTNASPKIKIIFATLRVWSGVPGSPAVYMIEANLYTSRWTYVDPTCPPSGPPIGLQGEETYDEASVRIAIPDYVSQGLTGSKTFASAMFPRQTYEIDYIEGLYKTDLMSQTNLNGQTGTVEIGRGEVVTDKMGWNCDGPLPGSTVFRQWNAAVTIGGVRYDMAFAVPDDHGRFLCPNEMPTLGGEFLANVGTFQVFYWDFEFQREGATIWEPVEEWTVIRDDHLAGTPYGVRVVPFDGKYALEMSNAGSLPSYLPLGASFTIPRGRPALDVKWDANKVRLTWATNYTGLRLEHTASLWIPNWSSVANPVSLDAGLFVVTTDATNGSSFYRLKSP